MGILRYGPCSSTNSDDEPCELHNSDAVPTLKAATTALPTPQLGSSVTATRGEEGDEPCPMRYLDAILVRIFLLRAVRAIARVQGGRDGLVELPEELGRIWKSTSLQKDFLSTRMVL